MEKSSPLILLANIKYPKENFVLIFQKNTLWNTMRKVYNN